VSSVPTDHVVAAWPRFERRRLPRAFNGPRAHEEDVSVELGFRFAALQVGFWLGWASIVVQIDPSTPVFVEKTATEWWKARSASGAPWEGFIRQDRLAFR